MLTIENSVEAHFFNQRLEEYFRANGAESEMVRALLKRADGLRKLALTRRAIAETEAALAAGLLDEDEIIVFEHDADTEAA